jgi:hypothetical protein
VMLTAPMHFLTGQGMMKLLGTWKNYTCKD